MKCPERIRAEIRLLKEAGRTIGTVSETLIYVSTSIPGKEWLRIEFPLDFPFQPIQCNLSLELHYEHGGWLNVFDQAGWGPWMHVENILRIIEAGETRVDDYRKLFKPK